MKLVEVEWIDSIQTDGWHYPVDMKRYAAGDDMRCYTVGYVLDETDDYILLVMGYKATEESVLNVLAIPTSAILNIKGLRLK